MAKKKTSVILPGGIQGLVHNLQSGRQPQQEEKEEQQTKDAPKDESAAPATRHEAPVDNREQQTDSVAEERQSQQNDRRGESAYRQEPRDQRAEDNDRAEENRPRNSEAPRSSEKPSGRTVTETVDTVEVRSKYGEDDDEIDRRQYHVIKDNTEDSWQLFLDMAQKYKKSGGKLATIYIDPDLKSVLDRLKYAGPERLSTSAILSSIVARFVYDHEDKIREILFGGKLI